MERNELKIGWRQARVELQKLSRSESDGVKDGLVDMTFCLISENPFACRSIKQILQSVGIWSVAEQRSFRDAATALEERKFDLVILDSGEDTAAALEFVRGVRGNGDARVSRLPIVAVTDGADLKAVKRIRDYGANAILLRPFSPNGLLSRIRKTLARTNSFIRSKAYVGPCRRNQNRKLVSIGKERRAA